MPVFNMNIAKSDQDPWIVLMDTDDSKTNDGVTGAAPREIPLDWLAEFEAAAARPPKVRFRHAFIKKYKPVMYDAAFRAFDTTADCRRCCEENLPDWLGYGRV